jgi:hypothetical protein
MAAIKGTNFTTFKALSDEQNIWTTLLREAIKNDW